MVFNTFHKVSQILSTKISIKAKWKQSNVHNAPHLIQQICQISQFLNLENILKYYESVEPYVERLIVERTHCISGNKSMDTLQKFSVMKNVL